MEALVGASSPRMAVTRVEALPVRKRTGASVRKLFPLGQGTLEFERLELAPSAKMTIRVESAGAREVITCETGELVIAFGDEVVHLSAGDVATLNADVPHLYENTTRRATIAYRLLLPRSG